MWPTNNRSSSPEPCFKPFSQASTQNWPKFFISFDYYDYWNYVNSGFLWNRCAGDEFGLSAMNRTIQDLFECRSEKVADIANSIIEFRECGIHISRQSVDERKRKEARKNTKKRKRRNWKSNADSAHILYDNVLQHTHTMDWGNRPVGQENATKEHHCQAKIMPVSVFWRVTCQIWSARCTSFFSVRYFYRSVIIRLARSSCHQCHSCCFLFSCTMIVGHLMSRRSLTGHFTAVANWTHTARFVWNGVAMAVDILISYRFRCFVVEFTVWIRILSNLPAEFTVRNAYIG